MNIVYNGSFLREGLKLLGHNIIDVSFSENEDIQKKLDGLNCRIDFIIFELWGNISLPICLYKCEYPLIAYCIDYPINEFWTIPLCKVFDIVFVDQKSSVYNFSKHGIHAIWLPLCIQEASFREINANKKHDIAFVGTISPYRIKRKNVLALLQRYFNVTVVQNISHMQMMNLFAESKIILNENLFSGLTLRIFQGFASGSLVLTEAGGCGVSDYFHDGEHLLFYTPHTLVRICENVLSSYDAYAHIALNGYTICKQSHTSKSRASALLAAISSKNAFNKKIDATQRKYHETFAKYSLVMRYGGNLNNIVSDFTLIASSDESTSSDALFELGNITARVGKYELAEHYYKSSLNKSNTVHANLKLSLLYIHTGKIQNATQLLQNTARHFLAKNMPIYDHIATLLQQSADPADLFFVVATMYFSCGKLFSLGFLKQFSDEYPDTAFETAVLAWKAKPTPAVMDLLLDCLKNFNIEGEMLPELTAAIQKVQLTDRQILRTAEIAKQYYDVELAHSIVAAFRKSIPHTVG